MSAIRKRETCLVVVTRDDRSERLHVPDGFSRLATFRRWARSDSFPETGRIDYVKGEVIVDMTAEDLGTHGTPKGDLYAGLHGEVTRRDLGAIWIDRARLSNDAAQLSVEPDIVLFLWNTFKSGRARLVPVARRKPGRYVEVEGAADLIVEVVSDSSEKKDTGRLRDQYFKAGVLEYWILDARGEKLSFTVLHRKPSGYVPARPDRKGFVRSLVLGRAVHVTCHPARMGLMACRLEFRKER